MNKLENEARLAAVHAHGNQTYDIFPYEKHLQDVVYILSEAGYGEKYRIAGWLHDVMEDGRLSYNDIKKHFGEEIAEIVFAVTDELGRNRKERKEKTYPKIRANYDAIAVKLADRIANLEHGLQAGNNISQMYLKEHGDFVLNLFFEGLHPKLWARLTTAAQKLYKQREGIQDKG